MKISDSARGALLMMCSMAAFTTNDALMKRAGDTLPLMQMLVIRGLAASAALALLAWWTGALAVRIGWRDRCLIAARSLAEVGAAFFFLTALMSMPLANVTALLQMVPLTVTLAAALFLGEAVGWRRWTAIAAGFCGMLLIVRPGTEGFDARSIYALVAVVFVTARDMVVRRMSPGVPSLQVTLAASVAVTVFAGILASGQEWHPVTGRDGLLVLGAAGFVSLGYLVSVLVMRVGEVSAIAPFRYTGLVWALVLGWLVFGDWPQAATLLGAGIIAATGIFTLLRERTMRRRSPAAAPDRVAVATPAPAGQAKTRRT